MENKFENIKYYGVAFDKFEILDFTTDFLAGVRANYFNSGMKVQCDTAKQTLNRISYEFNYYFEKGCSAEWMLKRNKRVIQQSNECNKKGYSIDNYYESDFIYKKTYFDNDHNWIKTEYFSRDTDTAVYCLTRDDNLGQAVIKVMAFTEGSEKVSYLFPKTDMPADKDYSILAYTNEGFLYYNSIPNTDINDKKLLGFTFSSEDFTLTEPENGYSIKNADYLGYNSIEENIIEEIIVETPDLIDDNISEIPQETEIVPVEEEIILAEVEEKPDSVITSGGESYNYYGETIDGKREGYGRTITPQGKTAYDGNYHNDKRNGFGAFYCKNGDINYIGNWENNKRNGFGVGFRNTDFTAHIGKWSENTPDGIGARFDCNGDFMFLGEFVNGKKQGIGITYDENTGFVVSKFKDDEIISSHPLNDIFPDSE